MNDASQDDLMLKDVSSKKSNPYKIGLIVPNQIEMTEPKSKQT